MPSDPIERRLDRIDTQQTDLLVAVTRISDRLDKLNGDVASVIAELGGAPAPDVRGTRDTIRWRLHRIENDQHAARVATAALEAANSANSQAWSRRQKVALFAFAFAAFLEELLRLLGVAG